MAPQAAVVVKRGGEVGRPAVLAQLVRPRERHRIDMGQRLAELPHLPTPAEKRDRPEETGQKDA